VEEIIENKPKDASPLQDSPFICQGPNFLLEQLRPALAHEAICRKEGKMEFVNENTRGLATCYDLTCSACQFTVKISSHSREQRDRINHAAVWGALSIGIGHEQSEEYFSFLGLSMMAFKTFRKIEENLSDVSKISLICAILLVQNYCWKVTINQTPHIFRFG
jgi:hypothetical protein